ncbi:hypothetical protein FRC12_017049 [Ceratobasidium sp. 428]|nr:hypothetical protein FRC12_017049 [Ceratobasidium sp. 428]
MSPPEQSNKSKDKSPSDISKSLISIQYRGRKAVIRRSPHYDVTISSVKKAFKELRDVSNDNIVISAFLKEFDDTVEVPEESWPTVLPEIKKATIFATGLVQSPGQFKRRGRVTEEWSEPEPTVGFKPGAGFKQPDSSLPPTPAGVVGMRPPAGFRQPIQVGFSRLVSARDQNIVIEGQSHSV